MILEYEMNYYLNNIVCKQVYNPRLSGCCPTELGPSYFLCLHQPLQDIGLLHLKSIQPLWKILEYGTIEEVYIVKYSYTSCVFFDRIYHRGSKYFIQKCKMSLSTSTLLHTPRVICFSNLPHSEVEFQWSSLFRLHRCASVKVCR